MNQERFSFRSGIPVAFTGLLLFVAGRSFTAHDVNSPCGVCHSHEHASRPPSTVEELLSLDPKEIGNYDIALVNLLCAQGLRGTEDMDVPTQLQQLDAMARHVGQETTRHLLRFRNNPGDLNDSEAYFRMLYLVTVVQQDFGIRYNPSRIAAPGDFEPNRVFFADARDVFLNGLVAGLRMGTCSSMPVLYVAVGRRLGYPLKLVTTKVHLFARWDSPTERLNIEATGQGLSCFDDDYYKSWPIPVSEQEAEANGYLKSLSPVEEFALFLSIRGHCLMSMDRPAEAVARHSAAARLVPASRVYSVILARAISRR